MRLICAIICICSFAASVSIAFTFYGEELSCGEDLSCNEGIGCGEDLSCGENLGCGGSSDESCAGYGGSETAAGTPASCVVLSDFKADVRDVRILVQTSVLFTVRLDYNSHGVIYSAYGAKQSPENSECEKHSPGDSTYLESVELRLDDGTLVAHMNDMGRQGDVEAGDGIFSAQAELYSDEIGFVGYHGEFHGTESDTFEIFFYEDIAQEEYEAFEKLVNNAFAFDSFDGVLEYISSSDIVESYEISGNRIYFTTYSKMSGVYDASLAPGGAAGTDGNGLSDSNSNMTGTGGNSNVRYGKLKGSGEYAVPADRGADYSAASVAMYRIKHSVIPELRMSDAAVIRPFRHGGFDYDDFSDAGELITGFTGGLMTVKDDSAASVDFMKKLDEYKFVLSDTHGTLGKSAHAAGSYYDENPYLLTGTAYSAREMWSSADWQAGRIVVCGSDIFFGRGYVAVGAGFFDKYYESGDLEGSIFFLGSCYGLCNDSISSVLIDKGASVIYGFTEAVSVNYCNSMLFETLINSMTLSAESSGGAFSEAVGIYGAYDSYVWDMYQKKCKFSIYGNSDYYIAGITEEGDSDSEEEEGDSGKGDSGSGGNSGSADIVILLDISASMSGSFIKNMQHAALSFIDVIYDSGGGDGFYEGGQYNSFSIGIAAYNENVYVISEILPDADRKMIKDSVSELRTDGGTNLEAGLAAACEMLSESGADNRFIIIMSDGEPNTGLTHDELISYADTIKKNETCIYSLAFLDSSEDEGTGAVRLMKAVASDGCYYNITSDTGINTFIDAFLYDGA